MQTSNNADRALRTGETGHQWEEELSGAGGTLQLHQMQTFRVRATGATTVTIDGNLAATMISGEIMVFCVGKGSNQNNEGAAGLGGQNFQIPVVITGAPFVQVARDMDYPRPIVKSQYFPA
jgi:hypothetical protein